MIKNIIYFAVLLLPIISATAQSTWYRVDDPESKYCFFIDSVGNKSAIGNHLKINICERFSGGLISINFGKYAEDDKWGCLNVNGDTVINGHYFGPIYFINGIACAAVTALSDELKYYCKFIDSTGQLINEKVFEGDLSSFDAYGWTVAKSRNKWYILSRRGKLKELSVDYDYVEQFSNGLAKCRRMNTYTEYIDTTGWPVVYIPNENYTGNFSNGFAIYSTIKNKFGFIDKKGHPITACIFDAVLDFSEGLAPVKIYNKWGFINSSGKIIISPLYDNTAGFKEGLACVTLDGKSGYIDKNGKLIIPLLFNQANSFENGMAAVSNENNLWGYISVSNRSEWIIQPQFLTADNFDKAGFAVVTYTDKNSFVKNKLVTYEKALISKNGKVVWFSGKKPDIK